MLRSKAGSWASRATAATPAVDTAICTPGERLCQRCCHAVRSAVFCSEGDEPIGFLALASARPVESFSPGERRARGGDADVRSIAASILER